MRLFLCICLLGLCGCATTYYEYEKKENKFPIIGWFTPDYKRIPICSVGGGAGQLKTKKTQGDTSIEIDVARTKGGALIDMGNILSVARPTTEVK